MRLRTLFAITLTMFALPAVAAELPGPTAPRQMTPPAPPGAAEADEVEVCYEVRVIKLPAGYLGQAGVKLTGDTVLTDGQLTRLLEVVQAERYASVVQMPKITVADGQPARVSVRDTQYFVTGIEATKVKGATVLVPKNTPVELGDSLVLTGSVTAGGKAVRVQGSFTRVRVEGRAELIPVVTQITPVFEGGSQGKPVPFTQYLQSPDVRTEKVEKAATAPADSTLVLGGWKETEAPAEPPARPKAAVRREKLAEYEVIVLATVRLPQRPDPAAGRIVPYWPKNVAAEDAARAVVAYLDSKKLKARVTFDAESNVVFYAGEAEVERQLFDLLTALDKAQAPMPRELPALGKTVFDVSDLVSPKGTDGNVVRGEAEKLVRLVTGHVRPNSWQANGGRGTVDYSELGSALVVTNTPEALREVAELLDAIRPLQKATPAPGEANQAILYKLRNVAAADAAQALAAHVRTKQLPVRVTFDAAANNVYVSAPAALQRQLGEMLAALDRAPAQVTVQAMVVQVPRGFAERCGLTAGPGAAPAWALSAREQKMLTELLRAAKERGTLDVLSRPQLCVNDGQTGFVQVGQQFPVVTPPQPGATRGGGAEARVEYTPTGLMMRVTPAVAPDGKSVRLTAEAKLTTVGPSVALGSDAEVRTPVFNTQETRAVAEVRSGETLVVALSGGDAGGSFVRSVRRTCGTDAVETLVILTPALVQPAVQPAGGLPK